MTALLICGRTRDTSNTPSHKYLKVPKVEQCALLIKLQPKETMLMMIIQIILSRDFKRMDSNARTKILSCDDPWDLKETLKTFKKT